MKLTLRIHFRMQKSTFKHKGRFMQHLGPNSTFGTLSSTNNTLELFFTYFSTLFSFFSQLFFFSFLFIRIFLFFLYSNTEKSLPPHLFSATCYSKGILSKSCFTMLQEQGYGWSYSRLGKDDVG